MSEIDTLKAELERTKLELAKAKYTITRIGASNKGTRSIAKKVMSQGQHEKANGTWLAGAATVDRWVSGTHGALKVKFPGV